jgi:hypothetical protein
MTDQQYQFNSFQKTLTDAEREKLRAQWELRYRGDYDPRKNEKPRWQVAANRPVSTRETAVSLLLLVMLFLSPFLIIWWFGLR